MTKYIRPQKGNLHKIKVSDINFPLPELKVHKESKAVALGKWFINWIENDKSVKPNYLLPSKPELAYMLGVSIGTVQNAIRYIEDLGYVEAKQCMGTLIKDRNAENQEVRKKTAKREVAVNSIKQYIVENKLQIGSILPASRNLAEAIGFSDNTTRLALEQLGVDGVLEHKFKYSHDSGWHVMTLDFTLDESIDANQTLVKKVEDDLKNYIVQNLKIGDRIPAHEELSKLFSTSGKTVHDALKALIDERILLPRRGRYGTTVIKMPNDNYLDEKKETSIFAPAPDTAFYYYERTQNHIKKLIAENYSIGSKLPSINEFAKQLDLSPNTIRKAFNNLAKEGYLAFSRGRYGGTFVIDIPETEEQAFKWLAVNPKYAEVLDN